MKKKSEQKAEDPIVNEIMYRNEALKEDIEMMQFKLEKLSSENEEVLKINKNLMSVLKSMKDQLETICSFIKEAKESTLVLSQEQNNVFNNHETILLMKKMDNFQKILELVIDLGRFMEGFSGDCARYAVKPYKLSYASDTRSRNKNK